jgi:hemoglobin-like flavoprotein
MTPETLHLIETSFAVLEPRGAELVQDFYARLFEAAPSVRPLFGADTSGQEAKLLGALALTVNTLRQPEALVPVLQDLGRRHVGYGAAHGHYPVVRDTMLHAMAAAAGPTWTDDLEAAWTEALDLVARTMLQGAEQAQG